MRRLLLTTLVILAVVAMSPAASQADELVLNNGDRLQGKVTRMGNDYVVDHPVLGEVTLPGKDVAKVVRGDAAPAAVVARAAAPAPAPEVCTRCPVPKEEAKNATTRPWSFWIGVGLTNDAGNTEKFQFNLDTEASYKWRRNTIRGRINWFYEEAQGLQTEGKLFANLVYERQISARGSLFAMWLLDSDEFADILYRTGWFVGYGHDFIKRERTTLTGKLGAGVIVESRRNTSVIETAAFLASVNFEHEFYWGDRFRAYAYVIPYVDYTERSPTRLELTYTHPLRNHLHLTAGFLLDYVPDPPNDIKPYDTKVTFGIRWTP